MDSVFSCCICSSYSSMRYGAVLTHMVNVHTHGPTRTFTCAIDGCQATYSTDQCLRFRDHVYKQHNSWTKRHRDEPHEDPVGNDYSLEEGKGITSNDAQEYGTDQPSVGEAFKLAVANFVMKTLEERRVTQATIDGIVSDLKVLWQMALDAIQLTLQLSGHNVMLSESLNPSILRPFERLDTEYLRDATFKTLFDYTEPVEECIYTEHVNIRGHHNEIKHSIFSVPLLTSLQHLLSTDVVQRHIMISHSKNQPDLMEDFCDGLLFKNHLLYSKNPNALQIHLYYDEVELCNPLGSKKSIHKLGMVYYQLGNLPPLLKSSLKSIQLLTVFRYSDAKRYGIDRILQSLILEVKQLEQGVEFQLNGRSVVLEGTVTVLSADNLSAQMIAGFKGLQSAFRKCRYCLATDEDMQMKFSEEDFTLRTKDMYEEHCSYLDGGPNHEHFSITYGIVRNSSLNSLKYFHVIDGVCQDLMHDLLEGTVPLCVKLLLRHVVEQKFVTLETINSRILAFQYGYIDASNRPTPISVRVLREEDDKLSQSASQMWCLARSLPFIVGDLVPEEDEKWKNFLMLLEVMEFSFAPAVTKSMVGYLRFTIEIFLQTFKELYPHRITPKLHYMIHIPSWLLKCGPLVQAWCMRFEAKHQYFKHLAKVTGNFKNIMYTLSKRHQRYMCWLLSEPKAYLMPEVIQAGKRGIQCSVASCDEKNEILAADPDLLMESILYRVQSVRVYGVTYKTDGLVVLNSSDDPIFGKIKYLYVYNGKCLIVACILTTIGFNRHYNAFEVQITDETIVCAQESLSDYFPLVLSKTFDRAMQKQMFVRLKHAFVD